VASSVHGPSHPLPSAFPSSPGPWPCIDCVTYSPGLHPSSTVQTCPTNPRHELVQFQASAPSTSAPDRRSASTWFRALPASGDPARLRPPLPSSRPSPPLGAASHTGVLRRFTFPSTQRARAQSSTAVPQLHARFPANAARASLRATQTASPLPTVGRSPRALANKCMQQTKPPVTSLAGARAAPGPASRERLGS